MAGMSYKEKRSMLIDEYIRLSMFTPEEERDNLIIYVDGLGYSYTNNKLVVRDITLEALSDSGDLVIDSVFDVLDAILNDEVKRKLTFLSLKNITRLSDSLFKDCINLRSVVGNKIKTLPCSCFKGCVNLRDFKMSQLVHIEESALADCDLTNFISGKLTFIEDLAFSNSSVREIHCGKDAQIQCFAFSNTFMLEKFTAESLAWVDALFYASPKLKYIDIGVFNDLSDFYDESNRKDRLYRWLNKLNIENKDLHIDYDTKVYNSLYKSENNYEFKFHIYYQEFNHLKYLKEFHYKLAKNLDTNLQKYYESRISLMSIGTNINVIRDF